MNLKQSEYNFVYDDLGKDQIVMYNSFTGALAVVKEQQYKQFTDYLETGKEIEDKVFLENALKCGYLVPKDVDERFLIKTRMMAGRYNNRALALTIAPTMSCNFRCIYCFEQGHYGNKLMDENTQNNIIEFVKKHLNGIERISINWFGGEPLLGLPVLEQLSQRLIALANENNIPYKASIITNGYLLTKEVALKLKECKVDSVQITVDGPKVIHDQRRPLINGTGTYDVIMKNIKEIEGILPISLRINVDVDNFEAANEVVNYVKENNMISYVKPYLGLVIPYNGVYDNGKCLSEEHYSKYNLKFLLDNNLSFKFLYPLPKGNYCLADFANGWVIDDKGYMYKCWNDIGIVEKSIGNVNLRQNFIQNTRLLIDYSSFEPTENEQCKNCKILPVCLGGCPKNRVDRRVMCDQIKFYIQDYLLHCTKTLLEQKYVKI